MMRKPWYISIVFALALPACERAVDELPAPTPAAEAARLNAERSAERSAERGTERGEALTARTRDVRDWSAFGMPVPSDAVREEIGQTHAHYRVNAPVDEVLQFFTGELPDFTVTRYDQGVKLEASDRSDRALYLYGEDGRTLLTYFDATPEDAAEPGRTPGGAPNSTASGVGADGSSMVLTSNRNRPRAASYGGIEGQPPTPAGLPPVTRRATTSIETPVRRGMGAADPRVPPAYVRGEYIPPTNLGAYF